MQIEKADAALDRIIDADARVERLADGFEFTEGPLWDRREGCLLFSDIPNGRIHRWSPSGGLSVFREPSFKSNGLTFDRQGRLIACEHVGRRVSRTEADGTVVALATNHAGKRLSSPNDVVVKSDGSIYFTDPPFGLINARVGALAPRELDVAGVWRISPDGSELTLVSDELQAPNGLAFTPDESRLYIDDSRQGTIHV
ncbi:MAG: SMP-30/gluconolactonase/LRE family protein, partial [Dehalococcoidia bacterium]